jgi:plasmid stabilization system protein ParE
MVSQPRRPIRRTRQLRDDIIELYSHIYQQSPQTAEKVFDAIERSIRALPDIPGAGRLWNSTDPRLEGMRVTVVMPYRNFLVFFRPTPTAIEVLRVIRGSRALERIVDGIELDFDE